MDNFAERRAQVGAPKFYNCKRIVLKPETYDGLIHIIHESETMDLLIQRLTRFYKAKNKSPYARHK